jgi:hypothetical protein
MKKVLSLLLVLTLVLGMSVTSFAAITVTKDPGASVTGFGAEYRDLDVVRPGHIDSYVLPYSAFNVQYTGQSEPSTIYGYIDGAGNVIQWPNGNYASAAAIDAATAGVYSTAQAKTNAYTGAGFANLNASSNIPAAAGTGYAKRDLPKVVARTRISKGANTIKTADLVYDDNARVKIEFVNPFPSNNTDGQEFDIWVYPVVDGTAWDYEQYGINWVGTLENYANDVDAATDYIDMYTGQIAVMLDTVRAIRYDMGPGANSSDIVVVGRGIKGQKYWGVANNTVSETDADNMDLHDIDQVFHLDQRGGLDKVAAYVEVNSATKDDYIFDGSLQFLGMGDSKTIPYRDTYYVADHMIEVEAEDEPLEEGIDEEAEDPLVGVPETGGDSVSAPAGIFDNPSTGA